MKDNPTSTCDAKPDQRQYSQIPPDELTARHQLVKAQFEEAMRPAFQADSLKSQFNTTEQQ